MIAAASQGQTEIVEYLLKQGANTELFDRVSPHSANLSDTSKLIVSRYFNIQKDYSALSYACKEGYLDIVKLLIQYGAVIDYSVQNNIFLPLYCS